MTIYGEAGFAQVSLLGQVLRVVASILRAVRRVVPARGARARQRSFDAHVDEALSIARQVPALRVVTAPEMRRTMPH